MARRATGFLADFQAFIMQGNVVDLAVAVIIGGAFGKIIESFVGDIITPAILTPALEAAKVNDLKDLVIGNGIKYGAFLASILNFLVIAFSIFLMIRVIEKAKRQFARNEAVAAEAAAPDPTIVSQERLTASLDRLTQAMERR
jgi:large conductance mechanosensitive channel